jgi:ribosomal protein L20
MLKHEKVSYSGFMERAKKFNIKLDLKMISELCRLKNLNPFLTMKMIKHIN